MPLSHYNPLLVAISFVIAILAAWTALSMAGRVSTSRGKTAAFWLTGGGVSMGIGIWSMHFIGMMAMDNAMLMHYSLWLTSLSMIVAIASSLFALWLVSVDRLSPRRLLPGSLVMSTGIVVMHYTGMAAIEVSSPIIWHYGWVIASVIIALLASFSALWLTFRLRLEAAQVALMRFGAAILMGIAIAGMHYAGMMAAQMPPQMAMAHDGMHGSWLAAMVSIVTLFILAITLLLSMLDARLQARTALLASSLAQANQELAQLALQDTLTRLPNRVLFEDRLAQAIGKAKRAGSQFALMFIDLDGFKAVNDAFGHETGDRLLVAVTQRLQIPLKDQFTLARIGGDEFVLLAEIDAPEDAARLAGTLVATIDRPFSIGRYELVVTLSIGIALYPLDGQSERDLMFNADAAMYHTKHAGRNGYHFFQPSMNTFARHQLQLTNDLWSAIDRQELSLHYQPKFRTTSKELIGFEALLRWRHPHQGLLTPDLFLPLAEKTGAIIPVGNWVINEACRQLAAWRSAGKLRWSIAVNLSPLQFEHQQLVAIVTAALARHQIPPELLILEITETTAMRNPEQSIAMLNSLTQIGIKASIDDFGTGYSSLLYLKRLPACELKIDRAFVKELAGEGEDATIVSAIVALARTLKLNVVAEGVETQQQLEFLTALGCDTLQGYFLGKPMCASSIQIAD
ncbi:putative bifunctional diguanylate cyclase/phosphodiesterase [Pluralibacter gergoviae]|uniref:cyclic-guanylate-specific phosphodiesterase n=1 Tax=Pluralibacter gergoviae TaxID=61647 RepID=A0AAW8HNK0_PLUGE|nr:bifunctional diguanylate cyclase/phosphodiesterase [Pluralibacter gergoviae]AVR01586.1 bifunctional diguanylate cyclase/phosphodiesterase [Pluralibacter gergoviae]KMK27597.1 membrane protein [Pluralibacter gergoviae]MDQ2310088.1 EAL domain-containing protein [Pluralibacter gergoviae]SUB73815.1 Bacteriophytochrome cph2 [Pluralibacter gergoviae]HDS1113802.1 EAL domain-containing protein [Pluralibacter gergoviae]